MKQRKNTPCMLAVLMCFGVCPVSLHSQDDSRDPVPFAVVINIKGNAWDGIERNRNAKIYRGKELKAGPLELEAETSLLIAFRSTEKIERLSSKDKTIATELTVEGTRIVDGLTIKKLPGSIPASSLTFLPRNAESVAGTGQARGTDPPGPRVQPIHESTVMSPKPLLTWPEHVGVKEYRVRVWDPSSGREYFAVTTPEHKVKLDRNLKPRTYLWEVRAFNDDSKLEVVEPINSIVDGQAVTIPKQFRVARESEIEASQSVLKLAASFSQDSEVLPVFAESLEEMGAIAEATSVLESARKRDDSNAWLNVKLHDLYLRAGRIDDAKVAKTAAEKLGHQFEEKQ